MAIDPLLDRDASLLDLVEAVRQLEYGRPSDRSVVGMLRERRGTSSVKHRLIDATFPGEPFIAALTLR